MFVEFLSLIEARHGFDTVDAIVTRLDGELGTRGAYTAVGNYPHGELLAMAVTLCSLTGDSIDDVMAEFAAHLMRAFQRMHPQYFEAVDDVFDFLLSVESHIHVDVRKLYPDASPPLVRGTRQRDGSLRLHYASTRPMAALALCMTRLAGEAFGQPLDVEVLERDPDGRKMTLALRKAS